MMDREERSAEHPAQDESLIALKLIATYAQFGLIPMVDPADRDRSADPDRADAGPAGHRPRVPPRAGGAPRLRLLRRRPGRRRSPTPPTGARRSGSALPQRAHHREHGARDERQARRGEEGRPRRRRSSRARSRTADEPVDAGADVRELRGRRSRRSRPGSSTCRTSARSSSGSRASARCRRSPARRAGRRRPRTRVKLEGELDAGSYGGLLQARSLVGVRGAGYSYDGFYYVKEVTHKIERGKYTQRFVADPRGARLDDAGGDPVTQLLRQVPRQGREQRRPAPAGSPPGQRAGRARRRPPELGDAVRPVRRARRSGSSRSRRSARTSGSSSRAATPTSRSGPAASGAPGEVPAAPAIAEMKVLKTGVDHAHAERPAGRRWVHARGQAAGRSPRRSSWSSTPPASSSRTAPPASS